MTDIWNQYGFCGLVAAAMLLPCTAVSGESKTPDEFQSAVEILQRTTPELRAEEFDQAVKKLKGELRKAASKPKPQMDEYWEKAYTYDDDVIKWVDDEVRYLTMLSAFNDPEDLNLIWKLIESYKPNRSQSTRMDHRSFEKQFPLVAAMARYGGLAQRFIIDKVLAGDFRKIDADSGQIKFLAIHTLFQLTSHELYTETFKRAAASGTPEQRENIDDFLEKMWPTKKEKSQANGQ